MASPDQRLVHLSPWATRVLELLRVPVEDYLETQARSKYGPHFAGEVRKRINEMELKLRHDPATSDLADQYAALKLLSEAEFVTDRQVQDLGFAILDGRNDVSHKGISPRSLGAMIEAARGLSVRLELADTTLRLDGLRRSFEALDGLPVTVDRDPAKVLYVVPCSGHKVRGGATKPRKASPSILRGGRLSGDMAHRLTSGRRDNRKRAHPREHEFLPAFERYADGSLWRAAPALSRRLTPDHHVLILSGAYGVVLWDEEIEWYDLDIAEARWGDGMLGDVLVDYAKNNGITDVVAFGSATKDQYSQIALDAPWEQSGVEHVTVLSPSGLETDRAESDRTVGVCLDRLVECGTLTPEWTAHEQRVHLRVARPYP